MLYEVITIFELQVTSCKLLFLYYFYFLNRISDFDSIGSSHQIINPDKPPPTIAITGFTFINNINVNERNIINEIYPFTPDLNNL